MSDAEPPEPKPFRAHHTAGQRVVLAVNCLIVLLCFAGAIGLLIGKHAGENGRKVEIIAGAAQQPAVPTPKPAVTAAPGQTLPQNLSEAIDVMAKSELVAEVLGEHVFDFFLRNKRSEWEDYRRVVTPYERQRYLSTL